MAEITFTEQNNGYNKEQVNDYIKRITDAYQKAYAEYQTICGRYNNLTEDYKKLESEKRSGSTADINADVIAKALIDSEVLAQKIRDDAGREAAEVINGAKAEAARINAQTREKSGRFQEILEEAIRGAQGLYDSADKHENAKTGGYAKIVSLPFAK